MFCLVLFDVVNVLNLIAFYESVWHEYGIQQLYNNIYVVNT